MSLGIFHPQHHVCRYISSQYYVSSYISSQHYVCRYISSQHYVSRYISSQHYVSSYISSQHYVSRYISSPAQTLLPPVLASFRPYYRDPYGRDRTGGQVQLMIDYQRHVPTPAAQASCKGSTKSPRLQQLRETMDEAAARR